MDVQILTDAAFHVMLYLRHVLCTNAFIGCYIAVLPHCRWRIGATDKAFGLVVSRSRVRILLEATLRNNLRQVVYTYVPLSPIKQYNLVPAKGR